MVPSSFDSAVAETSVEVDEHLGRLSIAHTMDDVLDEAARHGATADDLYVAMRSQIMSCPAAAGLLPYMNGLEATERGHQSALAACATPAEARDRATAYTRGFDELLGKIATGWHQSGCP
jgi:hypothetical protein